MSSIRATTKQLVAKPGRIQNMKIPEKATTINPAIFLEGWHVDTISVDLIRYQPSMPSILEPQSKSGNDNGNGKFGSFS